MSASPTPPPPNLSVKQSAIFKSLIYISFAQYYKLHRSAIRITLRWYIIFAVFRYPHLNIMKGRAGQRGRGRGGGGVGSWNRYFNVSYRFNLPMKTALWVFCCCCCCCCCFLFFCFFSENKSDERPFCFFHVYSVPPRILRAFLAQVHFSRRRWFHFFPLIRKF